MISYFGELNDMISAYAGGTVSSYFVAALILAIFFILGKAVNVIFSEILFRAAVKDGDNVNNEHIIAVLNSPIFYSIVLLGLYQSLVFIKILDGYPVYLFYLSGILQSAVIIIWVIAISKISHIAIIKIARRSKNGARNEMIPLLKNISSIVVWFFGAMFVLRVWNLNIMPLLASAGIAGFVIAFAAQDAISHLFSGISLYFDKPFRVGDRVQLDTGEVGDVLEIGIRSTRIKTLDDTVVIIPNKTVASSRIINYNKPKSKIKVKINLVLARGVDINKAKKAIMESLRGVDGIEKEPAPAIYFTDVTDSGVKFLILAWAMNPKKQFEAKTILIDKIYAKMVKEKFSVLSLAEDVGKK